MKNTKKKPLSKLLVLDLTRVLAGPTATQILGDLGADIIKVERPRTGDDSRSLGPPYLDDKLEEPKDLGKADVIVVEPLTTWELYHSSNLSENICHKPASRRVSLNDLNVAKQFSINGLGITLIPLTEVKNDLESGKLIRVLPDWHGKDRDVYAIWYRRQFLSTRASRLIDYLKNSIIF